MNYLFVGDTNRHVSETTMNLESSRSHCIFTIFITASKIGSDTVRVVVVVTRHASRVTRHASHVTRHTSHVTRHTSRVTRHASHVTRHTSHVTRHNQIGRSLSRGRDRVLQRLPSVTLASFMSHASASNTVCVHLITCYRRVRNACCLRVVTCCPGRVHRGR